jgi:LemA protein
MLVAVLMAAAVVVLWAVWIFNRLIRHRNRTLAAWSDIDVQLQRRHDLIPKLVAAVRGYSAYERATLVTVTELRERSQQAQHLPEKAQLEDQIAVALGRLIALSEAYPDLKADQNFLELQSQLTEIEDHLQYARRFYNGAVRQFNTLIQSFPDLIVANSFGFRQSEFFDAEDAAEAAVKIELG